MKLTSLEERTREPGAKACSSVRYQIVLLGASTGLVLVWLVTLIAYFQSASKLCRFELLLTLLFKVTAIADTFTSPCVVTAMVLLAIGSALRISGVITID